MLFIAVNVDRYFTETTYNYVVQNMKFIRNNCKKTITLQIYLI